MGMQIPINTEIIRQNGKGLSSKIKIQKYKVELQININENKIYQC
jgi:hypothetical protein